VLPVELDDMVYTFEALPPELRNAAAVLGTAAPGGAPLTRGRVAAPVTGMRCAFIRLHTCGASARRRLIARVRRPGPSIPASLSRRHPYAKLVERAPSLAAARAAGPVAVIDLGHEHTDVVVVRGGKPSTAGPSPACGRQLTDAIARH
jgi:hypothetical protein